MILSLVNSVMGQNPVGQPRAAPDGRADHSVREYSSGETGDWPNPGESSLDLRPRDFPNHERPQGPVSFRCDSRLIRACCHHDPAASPRMA